MSKKSDVFEVAWCDLVFENKNQSYGAYELRLRSNKRHLVALFVAVAFFVLAISSPIIFASVMPDKKMRMTEVFDIQEYNIEKKTDEIPDDVVEPEQQVEKINTDKFDVPKIVEDDLVIDDEMKSQDAMNNSDNRIGIVDQQFEVEQKGIAPDVDIVAPIERETDNLQIYTVPEVNPNFPGGFEEMSRFLSENVKYPGLAHELGITGTVYVTFVVRPNGSISDINILKGIGGGCEEEAVRVVKLMPRWLPGKQNGKAVPVQLNLPVRFTLK